MSFEEKLRWLSACINGSQLVELKREFKTIINSRRKYSQINSLVDLIAVLITRGVVAIDNVSVLNQISHHYLGKDFSKILEPEGSVDVLKLKQASCLKPDHEASGTEATGVKEVYMKELLEERINVVSQEVIDHIAVELGERQWRQFARHLNVEEQYLIDESRVSDKVRKACSLFLQNTKPAKQWDLLEVALESIRRLDLRDYCVQNRKQE